MTMAETIDEHAALRAAFPRDSYVTTLLRHRSASGMTRWVSVLMADEKGWISDVSGTVARVIEREFDPRHGAIKVSGCESDAGLVIVMELSRALYGDADALRVYRV